MKVIQLAPDSPFARPAAEEAERFHKLIASWGWESLIYPRQPTEDRAISQDSVEIDPLALLIYHFNYFSPVERLFDHPPERTVVFLHQLIPAEMIPKCGPTPNKFLMAYEHLKQLSSRCEMAIGHSYAATDCLEQLGFYRLRRIPYLMDFAKPECKSKPAKALRHDNDSPLLIFAGDLLPGSNAEDLIKTAWYCRNFTDPGTRLIITGYKDLCPAYFSRLLEVVSEFDLGEDEIIFTGDLADEELIAYFKKADVFLQLSSHDWTGKHLLQAMRCGLPVVALGNGAATEVLADAGILLGDTIHSAAADIVHRLLTDKGWRTTIVNRQAARLEAFSYDSIDLQLRSHLSRLLKQSD